MSRVTAVSLEVYPSGAAGVSISSSSAWASGAWVQVIASAPGDLHIAGICLSGLSAAAQFEVDIGVGGSGSETVLHTIRNTAGSVNESNQFFFLLPIPVGGISSGQRVSVRWRTGSAFLSVQVGLLAYAGLTDTDQLTSLSLKSAPAAANAASMTPSGTAWAWSAWVEIWTTTNPAGLLGLATNAPVSADLEYEIGFGGVGSEVAKTSFRTSQKNASSNGSLRFFPLPGALPVPGSTRVAVRMRKSGTSTTAHSAAALYLDNAVLAVDVSKSASESITVTDAVTAVLSADRFVQASEAIAVADVVTLRLTPILLNVAESIGLADTTALPYTAQLSDRIYVRESVSLSPNRLVIQASEAISVAEGPLNRNPEGVAGSLGPEPSAPSGSTGLADYWVVGA